MEPSEKRSRFYRDGTLPTIAIGTPYNSPFISTGFCHSLRNMFVPFPHVWESCAGRHIPDARNALIATALENKVDYIMQVDADQRFKEDFFLKLWAGIQEFGDDAIITGWAICKDGKWGRQPSVFRFTEHDIVPVAETELEGTKGYIQIDAFGTCGFLCGAGVFKKIRPPWFADLNIIHTDDPRWEIDEFLVGTEFFGGQDIVFATRLKEAGIKVYCATEARMPHEVVTTI